MYPEPIFFGLTSLYDLCLVIGIVLAMFLGDRMGIMRGFSVKLQKILILSVVIAIFSALFGAVFFQAVYNAIETGEFEITKSTGMTFYGGFIFGVVAFLASWFGLGAWKCKNGEAVKQFGSIADIAACLVPLGHAFGRLGCLTAGCCHGKITDAWYGVTHHNLYIDGVFYETVKVVPTQLFEALFLFALSGVLLWLFFGKFGKDNKGRFPLLPVYGAGYGIWRFLIEFTRADHRGETIISALTPSQFVAVVIIVASAIYFCIWLFKKRNIIQRTESSEENKQKEE